MRDDRDGQAARRGAGTGGDDNGGGGGGDAHADGPVDDHEPEADNRAPVATTRPPPDDVLYVELRSLEAAAAERAPKGRVLFVSILGCDDSIDLLEQFLLHYRAQGIREENMYMVLHTAGPTSPFLARAQATLAKYPELRTHRWVGTFHAKRKVDHVRKATETMGMQANDWLVYADSDEFHEYLRIRPDAGADPSSPAAAAAAAAAAVVGEAAGALLPLLELMDRHDIRALRGEFVDRVTTTGDMAAVDPARSPFEQYPMCCHFTRNVIRAASNKIVAWRPDQVAISEGGFHGLHNTDPQTVGQLLLPTGALVHHFKWTDGLTDEMSRRLASYSKQQFKSGTRESAELLKYLQEHDNRIDISPGSDSDCWPCDRPDVGLAGRSVRDRILPYLTADEIVRLARKHKSSTPKP